MGIGRFYLFHTNVCKERHRSFWTRCYVCHGDRVRATGGLEGFHTVQTCISRKKDSLNAIDLIKEKRSGKIKGRTVSDGRKQRKIYAPEDVSSPALSQDGFFASLSIDALENRHVATSDIAGAFLKADQDDFVRVRLSGPAVDAMLKINEEKYELKLSSKIFLSVY